MHEKNGLSNKFKPWYFLADAHCAFKKIFFEKFIFEKDRNFDITKTLKNVHCSFVKRRQFSALLDEDVKTALSQIFSESKMQSKEFNL